MNAFIKKLANGFIIDIRGEETAGQKFFVGKITFEQPDECKCPLCFSTTKTKQFKNTVINRPTVPKT